MCLNKAVYIKFHLNFYGLGLVVQLMPPKYRLQLTKFAVVKGTQQVGGLLVTAFLRTRTEIFAASVFAKMSEPILTAQQDSSLARQREQLQSNPSDCKMKGPG